METESIDDGKVLTKNFTNLKLNVEKFIKIEIDIKTLTDKLICTYREHSLSRPSQRRQEIEKRLLRSPFSKCSNFPVNTSLSVVLAFKMEPLSSIVNCNQLVPRPKAKVRRSLHLDSSCDPLSEDEIHYIIIFMG